MDFRLPQIVAAIEKLDVAVRTVFQASSESGTQAALRALFSLINSDVVLSYVQQLLLKSLDKVPDIDQWLQQNSEMRGMIGSGKFSLPDQIAERFVITKGVLEELANNSLDGIPVTAWYHHRNISELRLALLHDFLGTLYSDLRNMLADFRVEAELSKNNEISENTIVNIVFRGNVQNVQATHIKDSEITQNE